MCVVVLFDFIIAVACHCFVYFSCFVCFLRCLFEKRCREGTGLLEDRYIIYITIVVVLKDSLLKYFLASGLKNERKLFFSSDLVGVQYGPLFLDRTSLEYHRHIDQRQTVFSVKMPKNSQSPVPPKGCLLEAF